MIRYLGTVIGSGLFRKIKKEEHVKAFEELRINVAAMKKGEILFHEGDTIDKICIIDCGGVRGEKVYVNGELHILQIYDEGDIFGVETALSEKKTTPMDIVCNEDGTVIYISLTDIENSSHSKKIYDALMEHMADEIIRKMHKIEILAEKGLRDRILMYLNVLSGKSETNTVNVKMSREQLAQFLCVNRSALSNELNKMKREGVIDFDKNIFTIMI